MAYEVGGDDEVDGVAKARLLRDAREQRQCNVLHGHALLVASDLCE